MFNLTFYAMPLFFRHQKNSGSWSIHKGENFFNENCILVGRVIVMTQGTRCDGIINCWKSIDEKGCGSSTLDTFFIGKIFYRSSSHIIKNYFSYKFNMKNNSFKLFNNPFYIKLTYLLNLFSAIRRSAKS